MTFHITGEKWGRSWDWRREGAKERPKNVCDTIMLWIWVSKNPLHSHKWSFLHHISFFRLSHVHLIMPLSVLRKDFICPMKFMWQVILRIIMAVNMLFVIVKAIDRRSQRAVQTELWNDCRLHNLIPFNDFFNLLNRVKAFRRNFPPRKQKNFIINSVPFDGVCC